MTTGRALGLLIGIAMAIRLVWAASVGPYANEAYYYMYAQNLEWGYFDHPPMVGVVSALGLKALGGVAPVLGLRCGFIVLFAGSSWLMARLGSRAYGAGVGVLSALALNATVFFGLQVGTFAEPDGPLLFFWLLTLDRLAAALERPGSLGRWVLVGLAWGGALLSKYHAVLLPAGVLLQAVIHRDSRRVLRMAGPYLATAIGLSLFAPVVAWNARHGWASFVYQGVRAGGSQGLRLETLFEALSGEALYLTPWIWVGLLVSGFRLARQGPRRWGASEALLACQAAPAIVLFTGLSCFERIMPHWPLIGYVALMPGLGRIWADRWARRPLATGRRLAVVAAAPVLLGSLFVVQARTGLFQDARGRLLGLIPARSDPTVDTIRWAEIAQELKRRGWLDAPHTFLFTDSWRLSAELAMATGLRKPVACYHCDARSFSFWSRPVDWVGRDGIFVRLDDGCAEPWNYAPWFAKVEPLATFPIVRAGVTLQTVRFYRCVHQLSPFPFGTRSPSAIAAVSAQTYHDPDPDPDPTPAPRLGLQPPVSVRH